MGAFSAAHWFVILAVILIVFGPGRLSGLLGDLGKGIRNFRTGLAEDETVQPVAVKVETEDRDRP